jgi:hypothetical protein
VKQQAETLLKDLDNTSSTRAHVEKLLLPVLRTGEASVELLRANLV